MNGQRWVMRLVVCYVVIVLGTLAVLAVLSSHGSPQATPEGWGHAIVVSVFAVLLPLRGRAAMRGRAGALRAVGIIAVVLAAVNVVEAAVPHAFPVWMRVEMVGIAVLMGAILGSVVLAAKRASGVVGADRG